MGPWEHLPTPLQPRKSGHGELQAAVLIQPNFLKKACVTSTTCTPGNLSFYIPVPVYENNIIGIVFWEHAYPQRAR